MRGFMDWKFRLQPASFRGVSFKVSGDEATFGRRIKTYEYPLRDMPYTDDMGRAARKYQVSAYVVGSNYMDQRDILLTALEKGGAATLIHPFYGNLNVCVDGEIRMRHSRDFGGMCEITLQFVEAGELSYPTSGTATEKKLKDAAGKADDSLGQQFLDEFDLNGAADWVTTDVIGNVSTMLDSIISVFDVADTYVADAARLLQGDLSVLFPPPSQGAEFINRVKAMWRMGESLYFDTDSAISAIDNLKYTVSLPALAAHGAWPTLSTTQLQVVNNSNTAAQLLRDTALSQSTRQLSQLPATAPAAAVPAGQPVSHPAVESVLAVNPATLPVSYDQLNRLRFSFNHLFDQESTRIVGDDAYLALEALRVAVSQDIRNRLTQVGKMTTRTPLEVTPAVVLAADWYDDAGRADEIVARNDIAHPGFVPPNPLRVPVQ